LILKPTNTTGGFEEIPVPMVNIGFTFISPDREREWENPSSIFKSINPLRNLSLRSKDRVMEEEDKYPLDKGIKSLMEIPNP